MKYYEALRREQPFSELTEIEVFDVHPTGHYVRIKPEGEVWDSWIQTETSYSLITSSRAEAIARILEWRQLELNDTKDRYERALQSLTNTKVRYEINK